MRARILVSGLLVVVTACSESSGPAVDAGDARTTPELLPAGSTDPAVASDLEVYGVPGDSPIQATPDRPVASSDVAPAEPAPAEAAPSEPREPAVVSGDPADAGRTDAGESGVAATGESLPRGGGKPTGLADGAGVVPDRIYTERPSGIIDDPHPVDGPIGRSGPVRMEEIPVLIDLVPILAAIGRDDDESAVDPIVPVPLGVGDIIKVRGNGGSGPGPQDAIVNDIDPRRGKGIGQRAPRPRPGGSMPRGVGLPRGGSGF